MSLVPEMGYKNWCDKWLMDKFKIPASPGRDEIILLNSADLFQLRCSLLHEGSGDIDEEKRRALASFKFFDETGSSHLNRVGESVVDGVKVPSYLQLRTENFCNDVFDAVDRWDASASPEIQAEKSGLLKINSEGDRIGGIQFGFRK